jgi:hypothetical protein
MLRRGLKTLDELDIAKEKEKKEHEEEIRRESQLPVSASETLASADGPSVNPLVDFPNFFDNPNFVTSLANYNPLDPF